MKSGFWSASASSTLPSSLPQTENLSCPSGTACSGILEVGSGIYIERRPRRERCRRPPLPPRRLPWCGRGRSTVKQKRRSGRTDENDHKMRTSLLRDGGSARMYYSVKYSINLLVLLAIISPHTWLAILSLHAPDNKDEHKMRHVMRRILGPIVHSMRRLRPQ